MKPQSKKIVPSPLTLALVSREPFDYQKWRREYFAHYDVDELVAEVRKHHKEKTS